MGCPSILTIGNFDGVHLGHRALVARALELARTSNAGEIVAIVLDPHPASILRPDQTPARLSTFEQRSRWLMEAGADKVQLVGVTAELLAFSPDQFIRRYLEPHDPIGVVAGSDFRFGHDRAGDLSSLRAYGWPRGGGGLGETGAALDFVTSSVAPVQAVLNDHSIVPARSSSVRWLLSVGRVADAALVLGRPHQLVGRVVQGDQRGRTIGVPTANIDTPCVLPADGVYAARATLPDGSVLPAALSVGIKPTFGTSRRTAEAFLLCGGQSGMEGRARAWSPLPGLPEYGWVLTLDLLGFVRDQFKATSLSALLEQISRDCLVVADIVARYQEARTSGQPAGDLARTESAA